jgi:hypothetical protein
MEKCKVMLNGSMRECEIFKENTHTVWVYTPNEIEKRKRIRRRKPTSKDMPYDTFSYDPIMLSMMPSILENVEIENNKIVKRHKKKHNFNKI